MSLKTQQEKLEYAQEMLKETQGWAGKKSNEVAFWKRQIAVLKSQASQEGT